MLGLYRVITQGVVLRDLKPENIAFDDHYRACIIDFDTVDFVGDALVPATTVDRSLAVPSGTSTTPPLKTMTTISSSSSSSPLPSTTILQERGPLEACRNPHTAAKESTENAVATAGSPERQAKGGASPREADEPKRSVNLEGKHVSKDSVERADEYIHTHHGTEDGEMTTAMPKKKNATQGSMTAAASASAAAPRPPHRPPLTVSEIQRMRERNASFCGTAQHVSPEMLATCSWSFSSDLWALGTTLYECVYGKPMFSGSCTFDVLTKIVKNGTPAQHVLFPEVHFVSSVSAAAAAAASSSFPQECLEDHKRHSNGEVGTSVLTATTTTTTATGESVSSSSSPFERLKDFILCLVRLNPRERLGVVKATGKFDVTALRGHPFFADFDWRVVDAHVRDYRAHDFRNPPSLLVFSSSSSSSPSSMYTYDDGTPSLERCYRDVPFNDENYAAYVYEATADADPFQEFFLRGECASSPTTAIETPDALSLSSSSVSSSHAATTTTTTTNTHGPQETTIDGSTPHTDGLSSASFAPVRAPHPGVEKKTNEQETVDVTDALPQGTERNEKEAKKETTTQVERDANDHPLSSEEDDDDVIDDVGIRFQGFEPDFSNLFPKNTMGDDDAA